MENNDPHTIKTEKVKVWEDVKINDPVYWMKKQASCGVYKLLMPATAMQDMGLRKRSSKMPIRTSRTGWRQNSALMA